MNWIKQSWKDENEITCEEIHNVELTPPRRIILNDLTRNYLTFGLELLTKKEFNINSKGNDY